MAKAVKVQETWYVASDGRKYKDEASCDKYQALLDKVNKIMAPMGERPDSCSFSNGEGYIKHKFSDIQAAQDAIFKVGCEYLSIDSDVSWGFIGRYFDDSGVGCLYEAWGRLMCCDSLGREWGQQYYAIHHTKGKQVEWKNVTDSD